MNDKEKNLVIGFLVVIVILLGTLLFLNYNGKINFGNNNTVKEDDSNNSESNDKVLSDSEALSVAKDVFYKYFLFDSYISPGDSICGETEEPDYNNEIEYKDSNGYSQLYLYVKSKTYKNKKELYNYLQTYISEELITKKEKEWLTDDGGQAFQEKDDGLYCSVIGSIDGVNRSLVSIIDFKLTSNTSNKIEFTGKIEYQPANNDVSTDKRTVSITGTLDKSGDNWVITSYTEQKM